MIPVCGIYKHILVQLLNLLFSLRKYLLITAVKVITENVFTGETLKYKTRVKLEHLGQSGGQQREVTAAVTEDLSPVVGVS